MTKRKTNNEKANEVSKKRMFKDGGPGGPGRPKNSSKYKTEDYLRYIFGAELPEEMIKKVAMLIRQNKPHIVLKGIEFIMKMGDKRRVPKELISPHVQEILNDYCRRAGNDLIEDNHVIGEKVTRVNDGH